MSDRVLGGACLLLAAFFIWQATQIKLGFIVDPLGPRAFPIIVGGVLALAGLYPIFKPDEAPDWPNLSGLVEIGFAIAVLIAYAMLLTRLGFTVATAMAASILAWRLGCRPVTAAVAGMVIAVSIYAVFHLVLGLSLARGPWGF